MDRKTTLRRLAMLVLALTALAMLASQATAQKRGERTVRVADSDRDWASNRCERQAGLNRYRKDSDRDGRRDGLEDSDRDGINNAAESTERTNCDVDNNYLKIDDAEVVSYSESGGLTLKLEDRGVVSAPVAATLVCTQEIELENENGEDDERMVECSRSDLTPGVEIDEAVMRGGEITRIELEEVEIDGDRDDAGDDPDDVDDVDDD